MNAFNNNLSVISARTLGKLDSNGFDTMSQNIILIGKTPIESQCSLSSQKSGTINTDLKFWVSILSLSSQKSGTINTDLKIWL